MDILILVVSIVGWLSVSHLPIRYPRRIVLPAMAFALSVLVAFTVGLSVGAQHPFYNWRALMLAAMSVPVLSRLLATPPSVRRFTALFVTATSSLALWGLARYLSGHGTIILNNLKGTFYDGGILEAIVAAAIISYAAYFGNEPGLRRALFGLAGVVCAVTVVLSFRRTFWAEMGAGIWLFAWLRRGTMTKKLAAAIIPLALLSPFLTRHRSIDRIESFDFLSASGRFSQTNADHLGDLEDAISHIRRHPVLGIGLGHPYRTLRIRDWKAESWMVHNALLQMWLYYGMAGLITFIWFYVGLWKWMRKLCGGRYRSDGYICEAAMAYLMVQFASTCVFAPWSFSFVQKAVLDCALISCCIGMWNWDREGVFRNCSTIRPLRCTGRRSRSSFRARSCISVGPAAR